MAYKPEWIDELDKQPMLHIHVQQSHHCDAFLVMNEAGRKALIALLQNEEPVAVGQFTPADGECFDLHVVTLPTAEVLQDKQQYTEE